MKWDADESDPLLLAFIIGSLVFAFLASMQVVFGLFNPLFEWFRTWGPVLAGLGSFFATVILAWLYREQTDVASQQNKLQALSYSPSIEHRIRDYVGSMNRMTWQKRNDVEVDHPDVGDLLVLDLHNIGEGTAKNFKLVTDLQFTQNIKEEGGKYTSKPLKFTSNAENFGSNALKPDETGSYLCPTYFKYGDISGDNGTNIPNLMDTLNKYDSGKAIIKYKIQYKDIREKDENPFSEPYEEVISLTIDADIADFFANMEYDELYEMWPLGSVGP